MRISIRVKSHSRENLVERIDDSNFIVKVKELPIEGRANEAVIDVLAEYFNVSVSSIRIISGFKSRQKKIEII